MNLRTRQDDTTVVEVRRRTGRDYTVLDLADPGLIIVYDEDVTDALLRMTFDPLHGVWWIPLFTGPVRGWPALLREGSQELVRRGHGDTPALWKDTARPTVSRWLRRRSVPITHRTFGDILRRDGSRYEYIAITANELLAVV